MNEQSLKDRLAVLSKEKGIRFNECWKKLILERFLVRLALSKNSSKFIFKGGFLLSYMIELGRETVDLDFLATQIESSEELIASCIREIVTTSASDGFVFAYESCESLDMPHMNYPGYRVSLNVCFGFLRDKIHIDIGMGDIVTPQDRDFRLVHYKGKPLFESEISLRVYPPETIFAEKLETVISKGISNSRMKDYHDLVLLIRSETLTDFAKLVHTIQETFRHRGTEYKIIEFDLDGIKRLQKLWTQHLKNLHDIAQALQLPRTIEHVIQEINQFLIRIDK